MEVESASTPANAKNEIQEPSTDLEQQEDDVRRLPIKTYHCRFCSHLLIASTQDLLSSQTPLKRRNAPPGLDRAIILRLPGAKRKNTYRLNVEEDQNRKIGTEDSGSANATATAPGTETGQGQQTETQTEAEAGTGTGTEQAHYTIPLSTLIPETKPIIVRREDGFEKRILLRCGRCRVVVGYEIDSGVKNTSSDPDEDYDGYDEEQMEDEDEDEEYEDEDGDFAMPRRRTRRRKDDKDRAIYLLPGSIVGTEDLNHTSDGGGDMLNGMIERNSVLKGMEREWMQWLEK